MAYLDILCSEQPRGIYFFKAQDHLGRVACYFVRILPHRKILFDRHLQQQDRVCFSDYGEVVASCFGNTPDAATLAALRSKW